MKFLYLTLFLFALANANNEVQKAIEKEGHHPLSKEVVDIINNSNLTWKAKHHFTPEQYDDVIIRMGVRDLKNPDDEEDDEPKEYNEIVSINDAEIPETFDARENWAQCADIINDIRDQSNCGSCWAFGAVGVMSDRLCIATDGKKQVKISSDDLLSCCTIWNSFSFCGFGCHGGMPNLAFRYWVKRGIVSGGSYEENNTCRPYEIKPCHNKDGKKCGLAKTPKCKRSCVNKSNYKQDKYYGKKYYHVRNNVAAIQKEIMQNGPVEAAYTVYSDFVQYESGVYQRTSNTQLGGHAVRIIGWGVEKVNDQDVPYWLIANSWNTNWGDKGYFKILRGKNHCGIESGIVTGLPKV